MAGNQALGEVDLLRDASHCSVDYDDTIPLDISVAAIPNVPGAFLLHNILSPAECEQHMRVADGLSWEPSPLRSFQTLNSTRFNTNQVCFLTTLPTNDHNIKHVRLSERVMLDAPPALADVLNDRISPHLPQRVVCEGREWALVTRGKGKAKDPLNRRWRYNRYGPDGYFKPHYDAGPYPTSANAPRYGPDAVYSGLLECPCTDRITRSLGTDSGKPVAKIDGTVCETEVPQQADCEKAAADLAAEVVLPAQQHHNSSGKCAYSEHKGAFLGGYAAGSSSAGWATLQEAQAWCCSNAAACGGVTYQSNSYTARQPGTLSKNPLEGLDTWVLSGGGSKPAVPFNFTSGSSSKEPAGCSITVGSAGVTGYFNTAPTTPVLCGGVPGARHVAGGGAAGKVALALQLSEAKNVVTITMTGPSNVWFGVGFNAQAMTDLPWAIVVDGITGKVSEHKLADQAPGIVLQPSVKIVSSSVTADSQRTVVMTRSIKMSDYESNYFNFDLSHAVGNLAMFAQGGAPTCICAGDGVPFGKTPGGVIMYNATGTPEGASGSVGFGKDCVGSCDATHSKGCTQNSTLMQQKNPTCDNQTIPEDTMSYQMKARFYFQEYKPETHKQLYRWHWQTADGAGEYDITKCAPGTPPEECIHTLKARIRVSDFASGPCDPRSGLNSLTPACKAGSVGFKPIFLDGHCHAPTCLSMEMFNDDTGESICRTVPTYGTMKSNTTSGNARFEELGYLALPPCIWSENGEEDGLPEPPLLTWDANVSAIKTCNSTYYHTGEMARWQGHGVIV
eukprot:gene5846-9467_t